MQLTPAAREELQRVAARALSTANSGLDRERSVDSLVKVVKSLYEFAVEQQQLIYQKASEEAAKGRMAPIACRSGCSFCCHQAVSPTVPELLVVYKHIQDTYTAEQKANLLAEIDRYIEQTAAYRPSQLGRTRLRCTFLGADDLCTIYDIRPFPCRRVHSLRLEACQRLFRDTSQGFGAPSHPIIMGPYVAILQGLRAALQQHGLGSYLVEFQLALKICLTEPNIPERYLAGEDVFAPAKVLPAPI